MEGRLTETSCRTTKPEAGKEANFFQLVGSTPFGNEYEFEFARELLTYEKLGEGPATDLLVISLSPNDLLGHQVGPDSPEMAAMALALDRELADFFNYLGHQIGLANMWIALSADHGVAPTFPVATKLHIPAAVLSGTKVRAELNRALSAKFSPAHPAEYVVDFGPAIAWLNEKPFYTRKNERGRRRARSGRSPEASLACAATLPARNWPDGEVPNTETGIRFAHSYSPVGGWYTMAVLPVFAVGGEQGADHGSPYTYDTHVPLGLLWHSVSARNLSHSCPARRSGGHVRLFAGHQCSQQCDWASL